MSKFFKSFWVSLNHGSLRMLTVVSLFICVCIGLLTRGQDNWLVATISSFGFIFLGGLILVFLDFVWGWFLLWMDAMPSEPAAALDDPNEPIANDTESSMRLERSCANPGSSGLNANLSNMAKVAIKVKQH